jgi:hypothetical protein
MDPRILRVGSSGPQSGRFTQGTSRSLDNRMLKEHSPWNVRWIESSPTEDTTRTRSRFVLPGTGDILHAVYVVMELEDINVNTPIGPNVIDSVTFRGEGDVLDQFTGEYIAIVHDYERDRDENIGRDRLEGNISGGIIPSFSGEIIVDLPFWFRKNIHSGLPMMDLAEDRHSFTIQTQVPVKSFKMIFEVSDLPEQDRKYLSQGGRWSLPIVTRNRFMIHTEGRENLTVRLPFTDELCGIMFVLRPLSDELSGNYTKFNSRGSGIRTELDLDDTSLTPLYRESPGEILERASLRIGNMVLEDRESVWWRERAWWESGRQPPNRLPYVYARFWDITDKYPSGGTHLEFMPPTNLILKLRCDAPDCTLIIWGLTRNVAEIRKTSRRLILRNPYNGSVGAISKSVCIP